MEFEESDLEVLAEFYDPGEGAPAPLVPPVREACGAAGDESVALEELLREGLGRRPARVMLGSAAVALGKSEAPLQGEDWAMLSALRGGVRAVYGRSVVARPEEASAVSSRAAMIGVRPSSMDAELALYASLRSRGLHRSYSPFTQGDGSPASMASLDPVARHCGPGSRPCSAWPWTAYPPEDHYEACRILPGDPLRLLTSSGDEAPWAEAAASYAPDGAEVASNATDPASADAALRRARASHIRPVLESARKAAAANARARAAGGRRDPPAGAGARGSTPRRVALMDTTLFRLDQAPPPPKADLEAALDRAGAMLEAAGPEPPAPPGGEDSRVVRVFRSEEEMRAAEGEGGVLWGEEFDDTPREALEAAMAKAGGGTLEERVRAALPRPATASQVADVIRGGRLVSPGDEAVVLDRERGREAVFSRVRTSEGDDIWALKSATAVSGIRTCASVPGGAAGAGRPAGGICSLPTPREAHSFATAKAESLIARLKGALREHRGTPRDGSLPPHRAALTRRDSEPLSYGPPPTDPFAAGEAIPPGDEDDDGAEEAGPEEVQLLVDQESPSFVSQPGAGEAVAWEAMDTSSYFHRAIAVCIKRTVPESVAASSGLSPPSAQAVVAALLHSRYGSLSSEDDDLSRPFVASVARLVKACAEIACEASGIPPPAFPVPNMADYVSGGGTEYPPADQPMETKKLKTAIYDRFPALADMREASREAAATVSARRPPGQEGRSPFASPAFRPRPGRAPPAGSKGKAGSWEARYSATIAGVTLQGHGGFAPPPENRRAAPGEGDGYDMPLPDLPGAAETAARAAGKARSDAGAKLLGRLAFSGRPLSEALAMGVWSAIRSSCRRFAVSFAASASEGALSAARAAAATSGAGTAEEGLRSAAEALAEAFGALEASGGVEEAASLLGDLSASLTRVSQTADAVADSMENERERIKLKKMRFLETLSKEGKAALSELREVGLADLDALSSEEYSTQDDTPGLLGDGGDRGEDLLWSAGGGEASDWSAPPGGEADPGGDADAHALAGT